MEVVGRRGVVDYDLVVVIELVYFEVFSERLGGIGCGWEVVYCGFSALVLRVR